MAQTEFKTTFSIDDKASSPLSKIIDKLSSLGKGADKAVEDLNELTQTSFAPLNNSLNTVSKTFTTTTGKSATLTREIKKVESSAGSINKVSESANKAGSALSKIKATALQKIKGVADNVKNSIEGVKTETDETNDKINSLVKAITKIGATYVSIASIKKALNWSDEISQTTSRLNLVNNAFNELNGTQQTTRELQDKIFKAAQASRGSYSGLQDLVASLGNNARDAFSNTDEMVKFAENLNKTFAISGASSEEMANATLQLTQGLAAGTLRGDELNSVLENAPELINVIANSMGVPRGQIRELASEGKITAEVVKNALLNSTDEINAKFQGMNMTFGQVWTQFTNSAQHAFEPVANELGKLAMSPEFQASMEQLEDKISELAPKIKELVSGIVSAAPDMLQKLVDGFSWIVDNGSTLGAVITGLGVAFGTLSIISSIASMMTALGVAITIPLAPIALIIAGIAGIIAAITWLWNTNEGFRNFIWGCLDGINQAFQNAWNKISAALTGIGYAWDDLVNIVSNAWNNITTAVSNWWQEAVSWGTNVIEGFRQGLQDAWGRVTSWFTDSWNWVVDKVKSVFQIGSPSKVFNGIGGDLIQGFYNGLDSKWSGVENWFTDKSKSLVNTESGLLSGVNPYSGMEKLSPPQMDIQPVEQPVFDPSVLQTDQLTTMCATATTEFSGMTSTTLSLLSNMQTTGVATTSLMYTTLVNLTTTFSNTFITLWTNIRNTLIASVNLLCATVLARFIKLDNDIITETSKMPPAMKKLGSDMMVSLINGINSQAPNVVSTAGSLVQQLKTTFETGLGIHSPSDYMIWVGQMLLAGLIQGMSQDQIHKFVESVIGDMRTSFKNGKFNADELVDYLGGGTLDVVKYLELIGDMTVADVFGDGGTPAIIQEALKYVGYAPGGGNSMFGLHYGNAGAWCASFVRYCAEQVGVPFPATNYVPDVLDWSIATGRYTQTPQPGYAAIFGGGSHIELVAGVGADGTVDMVGGNTGMGEVKHRPRSDATSYVALDGGHSTLTLKDTILNAYNKKFNPLALAVGGINYNPSAGASQWTDLVLQALAMLGQPASLLNYVLYAIDCESSGDPNAINVTDTNAAANNNSRGLLQTIPDTFNAYRNPNLSANIYDPLANIYAGLNYMIQRYGGIPQVVEPRLGGWYGYAVGTRYVPSDMLAMIHEGEAIIPASQNPYSASGGDYLADIASSFVPSPFDAEPYLTSTSTSSAYSIGDINTTVNVSGTNADPNEIAQAVSAQIMSDMEIAMTTKAGVQRGY